MGKGLMCDSARIGRLGGSRKTPKPYRSKLSPASNGGEIDVNSTDAPDRPASPPGTNHHEAVSVRCTQSDELRRKA